MANTQSASARAMLLARGAQVADQSAAPADDKTPVEFWIRIGRTEKWTNEETGVENEVFVQIGSISVDGDGPLRNTNGALKEAKELLQEELLEAFSTLERGETVLVDIGFGLEMQIARVGDPKPSGINRQGSKVSIDIASLRKPAAE